MLSDPNKVRIVHKCIITNCLIQPTQWDINIVAHTPYKPMPGTIQIDTQPSIIKIL